jgi:lipopolysaccharide export system permease protein
MPYALYQTIPVSMSCSTAIVMILMLKYNEIMVCLTTGLRITRLILPFLFVSLISCIFMIISGDYINPKIDVMRNYYKRTIIENKNNYIINKFSGLWLKENNNTFIYVGMVDPILKIITAIKLYHIDENFRLIEYTKVKSAQYDKDKWKFTGITRYNINTTAFYNTFNENHLNSSTLDGIIKLSSNNPKSLTINDLVNLIKLNNMRGLNISKYKLVLYKKIAYPLTAIALVLLIAPMCIKLSRHYSYIFIISKVLIFSFFYSIIQLICESFGQKGIINPFFASFLPVIICIIGSIYIIVKKGNYAGE